MLSSILSRLRLTLLSPHAYSGAPVERVLSPKEKLVKIRDSYTHGMYIDKVLPAEKFVDGS